MCQIKYLAKVKHNDIHGMTIVRSKIIERWEEVKRFMHTWLYLQPYWQVEMCIPYGILVKFFIILLFAVTKNRYKTMAVCVHGIYLGPFHYQIYLLSYRKHKLRLACSVVFTGWCVYIFCTSKHVSLSKDNNCHNTAWICSGYRQEQHWSTSTMVIVHEHHND